ncbi:hypothetical protein E3N88_10233 [Mikania micrantha]|uniref:Uncharacterized protein n=1 Tax=Mikania micrantha TaxID=192012 RepID=A0A5N6PBT2_9ASTR|nr:hypothetical protein E3N88_10233 [Mikania micrantha]
MTTRSLGGQRKAVSEAKNKAYTEMYKRLETKEGEHGMFKNAKARERRRQDIGVLKFIKSEDGRVLVKENDIRKREEVQRALKRIGRVKAVD